MKTIHITSLGCPKNFVDSEVMIGVLDKDGWQVVPKPEDAAVLLVNTCGFIQSAVEEGIDAVFERAKNNRACIRDLDDPDCRLQ